MGEHSTSNRLAVDQPTRGADRNRSLADQADPATDEMLLPQLEDGITLLDVEGPRRPDPTVARARPPPPTRRARLLGRRKRARDDDHACPDLPSQRLLGRIHVARGFTAYQHYGAVCDLPTAVNKSIRTSTADSGAAGRGEPSRDEDTSPHTPALIVAPAVDAQYRADDTLGETHAETLQARTLARLATYADGYDIPVLVTRNERNEFTEPVATVADHHLECEQTRMGPRVVGEDFETLVYPVDDGAYYQTTFAYWQQLLAARATQVGVEPTTPAPSTPTPEGVGTGVTADGETVAATADPFARCVDRDRDRRAIAMGRTNPTYRDALRAIEERWAEFRRALRRRDQPRFDRLFEYAREHADASGLLNHQNPLLPALLSIDLEQEARLDDHEERLRGARSRCRSTR